MGLHGVETIEITSGTVAVQTVETAVIGLVGTAPESSKGVVATAVFGSYLSGNAILLSAKEPGKAGNISIDFYVDGEAEMSPALIGFDGVWQFRLGTDAAGVVNTTAAEVIEIFSQDKQCPVSAALSPLNAVTSNVPIEPATVTLSGGEDEPFPVGVPVVVAGALTQASKLGQAGTLYPALQDIFDQAGALVVVVRADDGSDLAGQNGKIVSAMTGFAQSSAVTGYTPKILIATGYSENDSVGKALETYAEKLGAIAYIDSPSQETVQNIVQRRKSYGGRVMLTRPRVGVTNDEGDIEYRPFSGRLAGLRARIDYEKGWWWSTSNQSINNITGVEIVDDWVLGSQTCTANLLNMENITTIIRHDGFRCWGNRLCTTDPMWQFETVRRTADIIEQSIQQACLAFIDRPLDKNIAGDIIATLRAYLRYLTNLGAIHGGDSWLDEELNTAETLSAGQLYINYDFGPKSPLERLTLRVMINKDYSVERLTS